MTSIKTRLVASSVPLVLAVPAAVTASPASADPASDRRAPVVNTVVDPAVGAAAGDPDVSLTTFRFANVVMSRKYFDGVTYFARLKGTVRADFGPGVGWQANAVNPVTVSLKVNGRTAGAPFNFLGFNFTNAARTQVEAAAPNYLGAGRWTVGPVSLAITDNGVDRSAKLSRTDTFFVRRPSLASIGTSRSGQRVTIKIRAQVRDARTWRLKSARRAVVERKVRGGWRLVRNVRVSSAGRASLTLRSPGRFQYRVKIRQTAKTAASTDVTRGRV